MTQIGRYDILEEIGRGGFATVYKARDTRLNRTVALKILHAGWSGDPDFVRRFQQEAETIANLRHPNIVVIHDVGEADRQLYIAMEFLNGDDLQAWLSRQETTLTLAEILPILRPVADALDYAHSRGIIHRDIKPSNMMRDETGQTPRMVLMDFGLVKAMENSVALTMTSQMLGSPEYMAPEQADPNRADEIGPQSDLYAFGIVAYQMLTGRVPFPGHSISTLNAHANLPVPAPQQFNPDLSENVVAILSRMLAKTPADRYPTALDFVDALQATLATSSEAQVIPLYAEMQQAQANGAWVQVLTLASQIELLFPGYRDVVAIRMQASQQLQAPKAPEILSPTQTQTAVPITKTTAKTALPDKKQGVPLYVWLIGGVVGMVVIGFLIWTVVSGGDAPEPVTEATIEAATQATLAASQVDATAIAAGVDEVSGGDTAVTTPEEPVAEVEIQPTPAADQTSPPTNPSLGSTWQRPTDSMTMVYVPADSFKMGSNPEEDTFAKPNEQPQHEVTLDGFWIDQTEVTNSLFGRFVAETGYVTTAEEEGTSRIFIGSTWVDLSGVDWQHPAGPDSNLFRLDNNPVVLVSWYDAEAYCEWSGGQLPTEAQWEYASRGNAGQLYPWGNQFEGTNANYCDLNCTADWKDATVDDGYAENAPVGTYPAGASWVNTLDMSGNVWEWAADWYAENYYTNAAVTNPMGPETGDSKVLRGGSWLNPDQDLRAAFRDPQPPSFRSPYSGFRCVMPGS